MRWQWEKSLEFVLNSVSIYKFKETVETPEQGVKSTQSYQNDVNGVVYYWLWTDSHLLRVFIVNFNHLDNDDNNDGKSHVEDSDRTDFKMNLILFFKIRAEGLGVRAKDRRLRVKSWRNPQPWCGPKAISTTLTGITIFGMAFVLSKF